MDVRARDLIDERDTEKFKLQFWSEVLHKIKEFAITLRCLRD